MLTTMKRVGLVVLMLAAGCSKKSASADPGPASPPPGGAATSDKPVEAKAPAGKPADDERNHLHPDEGTLEIGSAEVKPGAEATVSLKVTPAAGFHVNTDFPIKLTLEAPPAGVTLAKAELVAGGKDKAQGDASALSEKTIAFDVKATPAAAGSYEIKGMFKFGVCDEQSCHAKRQPVTIAIAAK